MAQAQAQLEARTRELASTTQSKSVLESRFAELVEWCRTEETEKLRYENEAKVASAKAVDLEGKHFRLLCRLQTESQHLADAKKEANAAKFEPSMPMSLSASC